MSLTKPKFSQIDTNITAFSDPITVLHQGATSPYIDVGFLFNRANGLVSNVAFYWSEATQSIVTGFTANTGTGSGNIVNTGYANLTIGSLLSINGNIYLDGTMGLPGQFITATASGTAWTDVIFTGGYLGDQTTFGANLVANSATASSDITTGALVVVGGVGISGALNVGANVTVTGNVLPSANVTYNLGSPGQRWKDLFLAGNTINLNGATISAVDGDIIFQNSLGGSFSVTGSAAGQSTGTFGNLVANSGVASTTTSTGALTVIGGAGISGNLYVGGDLSVAGNIIAVNYETVTNTEVVQTQRATNIYSDNYFWSNGQSLLDATDLRSNVGTLYLGNITTQANIGAYQLYANANAATQQTSIDAIDANIGSYQLYANTQISDIDANIGSYQLYANTQISDIDANIGTVTNNITTLFGNAATQQTAIDSLQTKPDAVAMALVFGSGGDEQTTFSNPEINGFTGDDSVIDVGPGQFYKDINGNVGIGTSAPTSKLQVVGLPVYPNNAAAIAGGLSVGAFYRTGADPDPVCVVH